MKTPSLEEVKAYFKNAKEVRCLFDGNVYDVSNGKYSFVELFFGVRLFNNDNDFATVYKNGKYAEIISYKDKIDESAKKNPEFKQYKHIPTGIIGELMEDGHLHFQRGDNEMSCRESIWKGFIENSSDWEEVIPNPVLFLTEDGVEIRQGDKHYGVYTNSWQIEENTIDCVLSKNELYQDEFYKTFSTRELASEYVLRNKPCLSVNDVVYGTKKAFVNNEAMSALVELAKSKISDQQ